MFLAERVDWFFCCLDDINRLWKELQREKSQLDHQKQHLQEVLQRAFDEVCLNVEGTDLCLSTDSLLQTFNEATPYNV